MSASWYHRFASRGLMRNARSLSAAPRSRSPAATADCTEANRVEVGVAAGATGSGVGVATGGGNCGAGLTTTGAGCGAGSGVGSAITGGAGSTGGTYVVVHAVSTAQPSSTVASCRQFIDLCTGLFIGCFLGCFIGLLIRLFAGVFIGPSSGNDRARDQRTIHLPRRCNPPTASVHCGTAATLPRYSRGGRHQPPGARAPVPIGFQLAV